MTNCTASFCQHGPTSASGANERGRWARRNTCVNGARARPRMLPASKVARCTRPLCHLPDAAPPRIRGIHRAGGVTARSAPRIAFRERQVEISNVLPAKSAKTVVFLNLSLARCVSRCACPRFSARGSRIPRSTRSHRRVCQYWSCDRRRQSNAGRGSRWRTSVCCSRAPNPRHPSRRR